MGNRRISLKPEDINCDGRISGTGQVLSFVKDYNVRECAVKKTLPNCAHCTDYPCERLDRQVEAAGFMEARSRLDEISAKRRRM